MTNVALFVVWFVIAIPTAIVVVGLVFAASADGSDQRQQVAEDARRDDLGSPA